MSVSALVISVLLLVANGFFVAAEFAFIAARRTRVEQLVADGSMLAGAALRSMRQLTLMLSGAQLGITMASLGLGFVAEPAVAGLIEPVLHDLGVPDELGHTVAFVIGLSLVVFLHMVIGEMVPKNITISEPERAAMVLSLPMRAYVGLFRPVIWILNAVANGSLRLMGVRPRDELDVGHNAAEIASMLSASRKEGLIEDFEHRLLTRALAFGERAVSEIMIPRAQIAAIKSTTTAAGAERKVRETGHSRLPVVEGSNLDDIVGFVHAKDLLKVPPEQRARPLSPDLFRRILRIPSSTKLRVALVRMRRSRTHFAVVTDERTRTAGIVTLEDVIEEVVGDIRDEHDIAARRERAEARATKRGPLRRRVKAD